MTMESQAKIISIELVPPRAEMEAEEREKGLGTELDASNKGFAMLQKMGYKKGIIHFTGQGCQMAKLDAFLSLDCATTPSTLAQSKERKASNFAAQCSGAIIYKPKGPNTYDLKIWL